MLFFCPRRERIPNPPAPHDITKLRTTLCDLADFCAGSPHPILVTGGLSIALHLGGVYRNHHDVDLAIFDEHLPAFLEHADAKGYRLVRSIASGHISPDVDMYVMKKSSAKEAVQTGHRHLRLVPKTKRYFSWVSPVNNYLDLFVYRVQDDQVYLFQEGFAVPREDFFPITRYELGNGRTLYSPNISFLRYMKQQKDTPTNRLDLSILSGGFEKPKSMVLIKEMF